MPLLKLVGFPVIPSGTTAAAGEMYIEQLEDWADGVSVVSQVTVATLHTTLFNRFAVPVSNGDVYIAGTPVGVGVKKGPRTRVRWWLDLSNGKRLENDLVYEELLGNASGEWNMNSEPKAPVYVTNAGMPVIGLDLTTAQGLFVEDSQVASTTQAGITEYADNAETIAGTAGNLSVTPSGLNAHSGNSSSAIAPSAPSFSLIGGASGTISSAVTTLRTKSAVRCVFQMDAIFTASNSTQFAVFGFTGIPSGWSLELLSYGASTSTVDGLPRRAGPFNSAGQDFVIDAINGVNVSIRATIALVRNT
jgi:hypothetical protein